MNNSTTGNGVGIIGVIQIVLIILKACNLIDWRWEIVLIPLWIELGIAAIALVIFIIALIEG